MVIILVDLDRRSWSALGSSWYHCHQVLDIVYGLFGCWQTICLYSSTCFRLTGISPSMLTCFFATGAHFHLFSITGSTGSAKQYKVASVKYLIAKPGQCIISHISPSYRQVDFSLARLNRTKAVSHMPDLSLGLPRLSGSFVAYIPWCIIMYFPSAGASFLSRRKFCPRFLTKTRQPTHERNWRPVTKLSI